MRSGYPILKKNGERVDSKTSLIKHLENEYQLTNQILHSILVFKKEVADLLLGSTHPQPENAIRAENNLGSPDNTQTTRNSLSLPLYKPNFYSIEAENESNPQSYLEDGYRSNQPNPSEESKDFDPTSNTKETRSTDVSEDESSHHLALTSGGQRLKQVLAKKFSDTSESNVISHYVKECDTRLQFVRNLLMNGYKFFDIRQVKLLWDLFVVNSFAEQERDVFFNYFTSIIFCADCK